MTVTLCFRICFALATFSSLVHVAAAQAFNIDLNFFGAPAEGGGGVPSPAFGAAANQPGVWNGIDASGTGQVLLSNLNGSPSSVVFAGPIGGVSNAFNNPNVTGDFALLLNDGRFVHDDIWSFFGLANGRYRLFTYAVRPSGVVTNTMVTVAGALSPVQIVSGPIGGNEFILGRTHSLHEIDVSNGSISVRVQEGASSAYVNGFQLVAVPEPSLLAVLGIGSLAMLRKRKV